MKLSSFFKTTQRNKSNHLFQLASNGRLFNIFVFLFFAFILSIFSLLFIYYPSPTTSPTLSSSIIPSNSITPSSSITPYTTNSNSDSSNSYSSKLIPIHTLHKNQKFLKYEPDIGYCVGWGHQTWSLGCAISEARFLNRFFIFISSFVWILFNILFFLFVISTEL